MNFSKINCHSATNIKYTSKNFQISNKIKVIKTQVVLYVNSILMSGKGEGSGYKYLMTAITADDIWYH